MRVCECVSGCVIVRVLVVPVRFSIKSTPATCHVGSASFILASSLAIKVLPPLVVSLSLSLSLSLSPSLSLC